MSETHRWVENRVYMGRVKFEQYYLYRKEIKEYGEQLRDIIKEKLNLKIPRFSFWEINEIPLLERICAMNGLEKELEACYEKYKIFFEKLLRVMI